MTSTSSPLPSQVSQDIESPAVEELEGQEDVHAAEMPMTMAASVVLEHLGRDVHAALEEAGKLGVEKSKSFSL